MTNSKSNRLSTGAAHSATDGQSIRPTLPQISSVRDVSLATGLSERQIRREVAAGKFDVVRLGERRIGILVESVERYIYERTTKAGSADRLAKEILSK